MGLSEGDMQEALLALNILKIGFQGLEWAQAVHDLETCGKGLN